MVITITFVANVAKKPQLTIDFPGPIFLWQAMQEISAKLNGHPVAAKVNEQLVDLSYLLSEDSQVEIITDQNSEAIDIIRHSTAHLLAHAVKSLFPTAQVTIGPVIDNGFYYDFAFHRAFNDDDLIKIEEKMHQLAKQAFKISRRVVRREEAIDFFQQQGEHYKVRIIHDLDCDAVSLYSQDDFTDLCRGPHVPDTGYLKYFKLMKVSGAYWRGDANNDMLQRIYGTAWLSHKALKHYLNQLEEAKKRDHRKLGKQMDLFHIQDIATGMVFWFDSGWRLFQTIQHYIQKRQLEAGYQEVRTPQLLSRLLWEKSGHWDNYRQEMFITESEKRILAIKPMSCPCHVEVYNQGLRSYRDLPIRLAEFGNCHRNEPSGTLHGLMRLRNFVQDDGHVFCLPEQVLAEAKKVIALTLSVYRDFGFDDISLALSTRPDKRIGDDQLWNRAEGDLANALTELGLDYEINVGDGAFYGPKIDFSCRDCLGRSWQLGTLQLDYALPSRLNANYIDQDGKKQTPVMLHRAMLGSIERFMGILLEHYGGRLPLWLAPIQVILLNISEKQTSYVEKLAKILKEAGIWLKCDLRNEKIGLKIREATLKKIPYLAIIGDREMSSETLSIRTSQGERIGSLTVTDFVARLAEELKVSQ